MTRASHQLDPEPALIGDRYVLSCTCRWVSDSCVRRQEARSQGATHVVEAMSSHGHGHGPGTTPYVSPALWLVPMDTLDPPGPLGPSP